MPYAYLKYPDGRLEFVEIITLSPGSPPPRPTPGPTPPDPNAPHPSHPIALPGDPWWGNDPWLPHPSHPIALPGDPWWGTGLPPKPPTTPGPGVGAIVIKIPPTDPPAVPPAGLPPDSVQMLVWFGPGTQPAVAWVQPYISTGPITPPA